VFEDDGQLVELIRDDFDLTAAGPANVADLVDVADRGKLERFLGTARLGQAAFDWTINVVRPDRVEPLHFGAARVQGRLVIIAAENRSSLAYLSERLADEGTTSIAKLRQVLRESAQQLRLQSDHDLHLYDELTRLNNQLAAAQRRLTKTNRALAIANEELRAVYEALPVGIFRADPHGGVTEANARFLEILGIERAADWPRHLHPADAARVTEAWDRAVAEQSPFESQHRHSGPEGGIGHVVMSMVPLLDETGVVVGFVGMVEDVTRRFLAEAQAREIERQRAIQSLTSGLAHHLNNILAAILGTAEELRDGLSEADPLHDIAATNMLASERAARLTHRLLVYTGQSLASFSKVEVDALLAELGGVLKEELAPRHLLEMTLAAEGHGIDASPQLFDETVRELVANACTAMPDGGLIHLTTEVISGEGSAPWLVIAVRDTGVGMDAETLSRAREPFFTTREVGAGQGLGLSLADGLARLAGGRLELDSQPKHGTTARLVLPAVENNADAT